MKAKLIVSALVLVATAACAQTPTALFVDGTPPAVNIDPARHGNLASAQGLVLNAWDKLSAAQESNHGALGGHAARAKELLRQVNDELKWAAETANER